MLSALLINSFVIALVVMVHYEALHQMSDWIPRLPVAGRSRVLVAVFGGLLAHVTEIWIFALCFYWYVGTGGQGHGTLEGNFDGSLLDCVYFSLINYTSLGYGDITPIGNVRFLAGFEGLVGLVMIAWTASFIYVEMTGSWHHPKD